MAMMIISMLSELTMSVIPRALPNSKMKNSGAFRSASAEPICHIHMIAARKISRTI